MNFGFWGSFCCGAEGRPPQILACWLTPRCPGTPVKVSRERWCLVPKKMAPQNLGNASRYKDWTWWNDEKHLLVGQLDTKNIILVSRKRKHSLIFSPGYSLPQISMINWDLCLLKPNKNSWKANSSPSNSRCATNQAMIHHKGKATGFRRIKLTLPNGEFPQWCLSKLIFSCSRDKRDTSRKYSAKHLVDPTVA